MLTLDPSLLAELSRAGADVRRMVTFELAAGVETSFVDGESAVFGCPPSIVATRSSSLEINVFTREVLAGTSEIVMRADGVAASLIVNNYVIGKLVTVKLGTPNVDQSDWVHEWRAIIANYSIAESGEVTFECEDGLAYLRRIEIVGGWIAEHPLEIMRDILSSHLPSALWNESTFNFETDTTRSHWSLSRYESDVKNDGASSPVAFRLRRRTIYGRYSQPVEDGLLVVPRSAWELIEELLMLLGGTIRLDAVGRLEYVAFDAAAAPVRHWTPMEYFGWAFEGITDQAVSIDVQVGLGSASALSTFRSPGEVYMPLDRRISVFHPTAGDDLSVAGSGVPCASKKTLRSDWLRSIAEIGSSNALGVGATSLPVYYSTVLGFCGARYRDGFGNPGEGGVVTTSVDVVSNVATAQVASHWFTTDSWIRSYSHDVVTGAAVQVVAVTPTSISYPLVAPDGPFTDGVGRIVGQQRPIDQLVDGREAYFLIVDALHDDIFEIVKATAGAGSPASDCVADPRSTVLGGLSTDSPFTGPLLINYTIERAQRNTTARLWSAGEYGVSGVTVLDNEATGTVASHDLISGDEIYTNGLSDDTPAPVKVSVLSPTQLSWPLTAADGPLAVDSGTIWRNSPLARQVYDITIAVAMEDGRIDRVAYGILTVRLRTKLSEIAVQIGDFVTHVARHLRARGIDGATSAHVFEVVSKNVDKDSEPPCILWTLKYVRTD